MRFTIEIYGAASDGLETLLYRTEVTALGPLVARKQASYLLHSRKKATLARVLNANEEVIYKIDKSAVLPNRKNSSWSEEDNRQLLSLVKERRLTQREIAALLGRTEIAVNGGLAILRKQKKSRQETGVTE